MRQAACITVVAMLSVGTAVGQPAAIGAIDGRITDGSGSPLPGALVTFRDEDLLFSAVTDEAGRFVHGALSLETTFRVTVDAGRGSVSVNGESKECSRGRD